MPQIVSWPPEEAERRLLLTRAAEILRSGGLVVYPTDTVYGLGADAACPSAIRRIYEVKGRPDEKAIIWLISSLDDVRATVTVDEQIERLATHFWPGALTLVLRRQESGLGTFPTLGVRIPAHPVALALIRALGGAVATTSANRSGQLSVRTAGESLAQIGDQVDLIIDAGQAPVGTESTVVDLSTQRPTLLRAGAISSVEIEAVLGASLAQPAR